MKTVRVTVNMPEELAETIKRISKENKVSRHEVTVQLIQSGIGAILAITQQKDTPNEPTD